MNLRLQITLQSPPAGVDFGLQKGSGHFYEVVATQRSGTGDLHFELMIEVKGDSGKEPMPDFKGPFVQGPKLGRFIYINIGKSARQFDSEWSRRLKIPLTGITWAMLEKAAANETPTLRTVVPGTAKDGGPNCATVKPFAGWDA
jgi:hypothetical protein